MVSRLYQYIPVYSGDDYGNKQIDKWVKKFTNDSPFKYIFKENARDVLNKQDTGSTYKTLKHLAELAKIEDIHAGRPHQSGISKGTSYFTFLTHL